MKELDGLQHVFSSPELAFRAHKHLEIGFCLHFRERIAAVLMSFYIWAHKRTINVESI